MNKKYRKTYLNYILKISNLTVVAASYLTTFICCFSDVGDSPSDQVQEDLDSEVYPSEDGKIILISNNTSVRLVNLPVIVVILLRQMFPY